MEGLFEDSLLNWACFRQTDNSTIHIDISSFFYSLIYFKIIFLFFLGHTKSVDAEIELEMNHHTHPCTFFLARPYSHPCTAHLRIRSNLSFAHSYIDDNWWVPFIKILWICLLSHSNTYKMSITWMRRGRNKYKEQYIGENAYPWKSHNEEQTSCFISTWMPIWFHKDLQPMMCQLVTLLFL